LEHHPKFVEGVRLFNEHLFWEAHEALEIPWREDASPDREFHQGLIHCAAALHHFRLATQRREGRHGEKPATEAMVLRHLEGAKGQWEKARQRLERFRPRHFGMDVEGFLRGMEHALEGLEKGRGNFSDGRVPRIEIAG
jgi:hypothetical protein